MLGTLYSATEIPCTCHFRRKFCDADSDCENQSLQVECSTNCKNSRNCKNRNFSKRNYCPYVKFKTWWGGFGLRAKENVKQNTFIIEYVGELIDHNEAQKRLRNDVQNGVSSFYLLELDKVNY